jgi:hypothetical protein
MSRFTDYDDDSEDWALNIGRWEHNSRVALKGKRGRQALRDLREALLALPEHRLIESAMCTVGGLDARVPPLAEADLQALCATPATADNSTWYREMMRRGRLEERAELATLIEQQGEGVCAVAAYVWHKKVKNGMDPAEAFAALPTMAGSDPDVGDPLGETAHIGEEAGLTLTLAWNLAYRNDETYRRMTPEERWVRFMDWIDTELAEPVAS